MKPTQHNFMLSTDVGMRGQWGDASSRGQEACCWNKAELRQMEPGKLTEECVGHLRGGWGPAGPLWPANPEEWVLEPWSTWPTQSSPQPQAPDGILVPKLQDLLWGINEFQYSHQTLLLPSLQENCCIWWRNPASLRGDGTTNQTWEGTVSPESKSLHRDSALSARWKYCLLWLPPLVKVCSAPTHGTVDTLSLCCIYIFQGICHRQMWHLISLFIFVDYGLSPRTNT